MGNSPVIKRREMEQLDKSLAWRVYVVLKVYYTECLFNNVLLALMIGLPIVALSQGCWYVLIFDIVSSLVYNHLIYKTKVKYYNRVVKGWTNLPWSYGYEEDTMVMMLEDTHNYQYEIEAGYNLGNE